MRSGYHSAPGSCWQITSDSSSRTNTHAAIMFGQNVFTLIFVAVIFINRCADCAPSCRAVVAKTAKDCPFGVIQHCGKTVCAKGSGEVCDRHPLSGDRCGLGYFCLCDRCQGCSLITLGDCFYKTTNCRR